MIDATTNTCDVWRRDVCDTRSGAEIKPMADCSNSCLGGIHGEVLDTSSVLAFCFDPLPSDWLRLSEDDHADSISFILVQSGWRWFGQRHDPMF